MLITQTFSNISVLSFFLFIVSCNQQDDIYRNLKSLDDHNFQILDSYLKDKSVVGIGENTHGDGKLFELKTEIIKHLHENLGFEAVLMESDFLAVDNTIPALATHSLKDATNTGIQSTWANSREYLSLIKYLKTAARKGDTLFFHGFDSQMTGTKSIDFHLAQAKLIKNRVSTDDYNNLISSLEIIRERNLSTVTLDSLKKIEKSIKNIKESLNYATPKSEQWMKNIEANLKALIYLKLAPPVTPSNIPEIFSHPNYLMSESIRDSMMADNIKYYLKKYRKVIIWAANKHLQHKSDHKTWMGELLKNELGEKYYSIMVLNHHGIWSYPEGEPKGFIPEPVEGTLAFKIGKSSNSEIAFLDLRNSRIPKMIVRTNNWMRTDSIFVNDYCDAILFVRRSTGSTMAEEGD